MYLGYRGVKKTDEAFIKMVKESNDALEKKDSEGYKNLRTAVDHGFVYLVNDSKTKKDKIIVPKDEAKKNERAL